MRRLLTLNVLDAFISGAYTLVIPLLLVERGIDVATIGVVFSVYPLAFLLLRTEEADRRVHDLWTAYVDGESVCRRKHGSESPGRFRR